MMVPQADILQARILVADDQAEIVQLLEQLLHDAGYTAVMSTMQPENVCELHRTHDFDLILLDVKMPAMDGFQVMESLKLDDGNRYLPVIVLTAEPGHKLRALLAGARDFLSKPFDLVEVKTRIRNMLELRLLYRTMATQNLVLEDIVQTRTAELAASEARFRGLTELASDWYWEQNATGDFTTVCGPVAEMLGLDVSRLFAVAHTPPGDNRAIDWNSAERAVLQSKIAAKEPFRDFSFSRTNADGSQQTFHVSGEPMFDRQDRYTGYRGIGHELRA